MESGEVECRGEIVITELFVVPELELQQRIYS